MLIAGINKERTRFFLSFYGDIKNVSGISLTFDCGNCKYIKFMHTDKSLFLKKLKEMIPYSVVFVPNLSKDNLKEVEMFRRYEEECFKRCKVFKRNTTNKNTVDGFTDNIPFQGKYRSLPNNGSDNAMTYRISTTKSAGIFNRKRIDQSYSIDDPFEFIIIEVGGIKSQLDKYKGNFCIIPKSELLTRKILLSPGNPGKKIYIFALLIIFQNIGQKNIGIILHSLMNLKRIIQIIVLLEHLIQILLLF